MLATIATVFAICWLLIKKLEVYGVIILTTWIEKLVVVSDHEESREARVKHGVPQASILEPLFLILFILICRCMWNLNWTFMPTTLLLQLLHTSASWQNWNTNCTKQLCQWITALGRRLLMRKRRRFWWLSTLNLSLDLNFFSRSNVYWECYKLIYIYFFFQEINDSLKSLLFYPVHFKLLIDDLIKIEFYLRVNLNSSLRKYCRHFLHSYKDSQTDACC